VSLLFFPSWLLPLHSVCPITSHCVEPKQSHVTNSCIPSLAGFTWSVMDRSMGWWVDEHTPNFNKWTCYFHLFHFTHAFFISWCYENPTGVTRSTISTRSTSLNGIPDEPTAITLEKVTKADRWNEIRFLTDEEAVAQLTGDELESYQGYHSECKEGINKLKGVAEMMLKSLEPPQIKPKGKKARKRDKWNLSQRVVAARAAEAAK